MLHPTKKGSSSCVDNPFELALLLSITKGTGQLAVKYILQIVGVVMCYITVL